MRHHPSGGTRRVRAPSLGLVFALAACGAPPDEADVPDGPVEPRAELAVAVDGGEVLTLERAGSTEFLVLDGLHDDAFLVRGPDEVLRVPFEAGDRPGRAVALPDGRVLVSLWDGGAVAWLDPVRGAVEARQAVCAAPRGLALAPAGDHVLVACAGGALLELPVAGGEPTRRVTLDADLRDLAFDVDQQTLYVSRFRSAEVLYLDPADLAVRARWSPAPFREAGTGRLFVPSVARRLRARPEGGFGLLHERAMRNPISQSLTAVEPPTPQRPTPQTSGGSYGAPASAPGALGFCTTGVVQSTLSEWGPDAAAEPPAEASSPVLVGVSLASDFVYAGDDQHAFVHVAAAGGVHGFERAGQARGAAAAPGAPTCAQRDGVLESGGAVSAVGRSRATMVAPVADHGALLFGGRRVSLPVTPPGPEVALFHAVQPSGVACASCHPGGAEDGRTWVFEGKGFRRTQTLLATERAPFHRDGEHADFDALWVDAFVASMGGEQLPSADIAAMHDYVARLRPRPFADASPSEDGRRAFAEAGCAGCHGDDARGSTELEDVGSGGGLLLAPTLEGIAGRAPYFHDGCAATLEQTLDGTCTDERHVAPPALRAAIAQHLATVR